ncbi:MAG: hypothetical protein QW035_00995 [Candidatus Anstonellales archaeon]
MNEDEKLSKVIEDLKQDGIKAAVLTRTGETVVSSFNTKGIGQLIAKAYNTAQLLMAENEDKIGNFTIKGDSRYIFIYEIGEGKLLVGISSKEEDEKIIRGSALMLKG